MLFHILNWISAMFVHHGWATPSVSAVSHSMGWVESHNGRWLIRVCRLGTKGCEF